MNILFSIPPSKGKRNIFRGIDCSHDAKADYLWQPYDLLIMSSYIKDEDNFHFIDGTVEKNDEKEFFARFDNIKKDIIDVIVICTGSASYHDDIYYMEKLRKMFFNTTICVLGDIFVDEYFRKDILQKDFDGIIFKPYNINFEDISKIRKLRLDEPQKKIVTQCLITDYKEHPFFQNSKKLTITDSEIPKHEVFKNKNYSWPFNTRKNFTTISTMWGCTYSCSYCTSGLMHPIARSNKSIITELEYIKKLGFKEIQFSDKIFGVPKPERKKLLREMVQKKLNLSFSCYFHPSMYDEEILELMKSAGCHTIVIGIDSADLKNLVNYNRKVNIDTLDKLLQKTKQLKMNVCGDFIIGLPHESKEDILKTISFSKKIKIDFASFNIFAFTPGNTERTKAVASGEILESHCEETLNPTAINKNLSQKELDYLRKRANREFYLRPWMLFRRLVRLKSFEHFLIQIQQLLGIIKKNFFY